MTEPKRVLDRLLNDPTHLDELAELAFEVLLDRPLDDLVDPEWLAQAIGEGIRAAARSDELETWVAERVEETLAHADRLHGEIGEFLPATLLGPLEESLSREIHPDPDLVRVLVDHPSFRELVGAMLQENLLEFGRKLGDAVKDTSKRVPGGGFASALAGVAAGVASAASKTMEKSMEERVKRFVQHAVGRAVDSTIARVADPAHAADMARWRVDALRGLMQHPVEALVAERHKYPPNLLAADASKMLRALAGWRGLTDAVGRSVEQVFDSYGERSARAWLAGSGLEEAWRPQLQSLLAQQMRGVVGSEAFEGWLTRILSDA